MAAKIFSTGQSEYRAWVAGQTWYAALSTDTVATIETNGTATEPGSGIGYTRQAVTLTNNGTNVVPSATLRFGRFTSAPASTAKSVIFFHASSGGSPVMGYDISSPITIAIGDTVEILTTDLTIGPTTAS